MLRVITTALKKTDRKRWDATLSFHADWEPRTEKIAGFIPKNTRVIEFGAANRLLERYLDPSCTYTPSDMVDRGSGTTSATLTRDPFRTLAPTSMTLPSRSACSNTCVIFLRYSIG